MLSVLYIIASHKDFVLLLHVVCVKETTVSVCVLQSLSETLSSGKVVTDSVGAIDVLLRSLPSCRLDEVSSGLLNESVNRTSPVVCLHNLIQLASSFNVERLTVSDELLVKNNSEVLCVVGSDCRGHCFLFLSSLWNNFFDVLSIG